MGTLPTFLAISGFVFLVIMLSYSTLKAKANGLAKTKERMRELAEQRQQLVAQFLPALDRSFLEWPGIEDAHALLRQQDQVLDKVDQAAVAAGLSEEGITAFTEHLGASQEAMEEYHQLVHQYNHLVTQRPNSFMAKAMGLQTV